MEEPVYQVNDEIEQDKAEEHTNLNKWIAILAGISLIIYVGIQYKEKC